MLGTGWPKRWTHVLVALAALTALSAPAPARAADPVPDAAGAVAPETGGLRGTVTMRHNGAPLHNVAVIVENAGRATVTDPDGRYEILGLPPGGYEIIAQREHLSDQRVTVRIEPGVVATADFVLEVTGVHEHVTVTASPTGAVRTFEAFNAVTVLDSFELAKNMGGSIGETLGHLPGLAQRSFGPGSSRPIIRGFDGDRVLIVQDGIRTGDLSSQSGDHGVTLDPGSLERLEVVRGPATLLYGSNAVGGVVNAITPHESFRTRPVQGFVGHVTTDVGSANQQAAGNTSVQFANGPWLLWGAGGARRSGDYSTPDGEIPNSEARLASARAGFGYFGGRSFFSLGYQGETGRHGVPFAGEFHDHGHDDAQDAMEEPDDGHEVLVDLQSRRHSVRFDAGLVNLEHPVIASARIAVNYLDWRHDEIESDAGVETLGTRFDNDTLVLRAEFDQQRVGRLSGRAGVSAQFRDYAATGTEALAPPARQRAFAAFGYEELALGRARAQFGARVEHNGYDAAGRSDADGELPDGNDVPVSRDRGFTGVSGSFGVHVDLAPHMALVATLTRSYRAPALEELYNYGPHAGNQLFEIGNPDLQRESALSFDVALRHDGPRVRGELNAFLYRIDGFVFPALTGEERDGLLVAQYLQRDSRFAGFDARGAFRVRDDTWVRVGAGHVDATLTDTSEPLPRIPPFRISAGVEWQYRALTLGPELVVAAKQDRVYGPETPTDGYAVLNLDASWLVPRHHVTHQFAVRAYNLTNELYRNHTSYIKDLAPEVGRGVKFSYSMKFF